jgi:hypothetical protein
MRELKDPEQSRRNYMAAQVRRSIRMANATPNIKMHVSPWVLDPADGCMTRTIRQVERPRNQPAVAVDSKSGVGGRGVADETQSESAGL